MAFPSLISRSTIFSQYSRNLTATRLGRPRPWESIEANSIDASGNMALRLLSFCRKSSVTECNCFRAAKTSLMIQSTRARRACTDPRLRLDDAPTAFCLLLSAYCFLSQPVEDRRYNDQTGKAA